MSRTRGFLDWCQWWMAWVRLPKWSDERRAILGLAASRKAVNRAGIAAAVARREDIHFRSEDWIEWRDFGAGSAHGGDLRRSRISDLARAAASDARKGRWLAAIAHAVSSAADGKAIRIIELGTCLGSGADFLLSGAPAGSAYVGFEGSEALARLTEARLAVHGDAGKEISVVTGPFSSTLHHARQYIGEVDVAFLDGCHEGAALRDQWQWVRPMMKPGGMVVVDDIRWSLDMYDAWCDIAADRGVVAMDMFRMGVLALSSEPVEPAAGPMRPPMWHCA